MKSQDFDNINYTEEERKRGTRFPMIYAFVMEKEGATFVVKKSEAPFFPQPFWEERERRFGQNPNSPLELVFETKVLRFVPIERRMRTVISDGGVNYFYPPYTAKRNTSAPNGVYKSDLEILVALPGGDELFVLKLKGMTKSYAWNNDPNRKFNEDFPVGAWQKLVERAREMSEHVGRGVPPWCTILSDFRGVSKEGEVHFISVGISNTWVNPLTLDLREDENEKLGPKTRYTGPAEMNRLWIVRNTIGKEWKEEWRYDKKGEVGRSKSDSFESPKKYAPNDDIPF